MKRQIFFGIGLFILLLPFVNSATPLAVDASQDSSFPSSPELNAVVDGDKIVYNVSTFQYGEGIWEVLDMLLQQVDAPEFDKGIIGSLEGTELITYIAKTDALTLYEWNDMYGGYENATAFNGMNIFSFLKLNQELGVYADPSSFTFPDDFRNTDYSYYHDYWPYADFVDPIDDQFWSAFNMTFSTGFNNGWYEADQGWGFSAWEPWADNYNDNDIYWFGNDYGYYMGYRLGYDGYHESGANPAWDDWALALDGYYYGFLEAWEDGFLEGRLDFNSTRIPDQRFDGVIPSPADVFDYGRYSDYQRTWEMFYSRGYRYEAAKVDFNFDLYNKLYDNAHDTFWRGYVDGYRDYYWSGQNDGYYSNPWDYYPPFDDPRGPRDEGYLDGCYDGYVAGYDDGQYGYSVGEQYMYGMDNYVWDSYFDGFDVGAADKLASNPYDDVPASLPYSASTTDPYEQGANFIYEHQYGEGYSNGFLFVALVNSLDDLDWLQHVGPFYMMNLPYFDFTLDAGSVIPTPMMGFTMLTDLEGLVDHDWEFDWGAHDYGHFNEPVVPMQTFYAGDTNWASLDTFYKYRSEENKTEEIITTYDVGNNLFWMDFKMYDPDPELSMNVTWCYDTLSGYLLNVSMDLSFNSMDDVWASIVLELDESRADNITPSLPTPDSWMYSINNFVFYFDLPPTATPDFVDDVVEFKNNGLSSIGNPLLSVDMIGYDGLWAEAEMTMYDPANTSKVPEIANYEWPIFSPQGPQWSTDYELLDGVWTTLNSIFGTTAYIDSALTALSVQNTNFNLYDLDLNLVADKFTYSDAGNPIVYYYVTVDAALDVEWSMLNGDFEWETITEEGWIRGTIWVGVDELTGVVLGAGVKTSFDFEVTQTPDYGMNGGLVSAYMEIMVGSTFRALPDLYSVLSGLPLVPEYAVVSIISIIGLAAIASAVIYNKKR
ncbi:MAG: hypothetical protein GOP50_04965 [Candidatus Heimdallarchaeota archaeon]|nr:hypothetical protein [Candidatus Heimdallarchaeota archaeon]